MLQLDTIDLKIIAVLKENSKLSYKEIADKIAEENKMPNDKLILDQPDTITNKGKIEHVVADTNPQPINDSTENKPNSEVLLTENPLDGVSIIRG